MVDISCCFFWSKYLNPDLSKMGWCTKIMLIFFFEEKITLIIAMPIFLYMYSIC